MRFSPLNSRPALAKCAVSPAFFYCPRLSPHKHWPAPAAAPCLTWGRAVFCRRKAITADRLFGVGLLDQNTNWSGTSKAPAINDADKNIVTTWLVVGANYTINRDWGLGIRIPTASRSFLTDTVFPDVPQDLQKYTVSSVGDIQLMGMYTGFSNDMSKGIIFGIQVPTGNYTAHMR